MSIDLSIKYTEDVAYFFQRMDKKKTIRYMTFKVGKGNVVDVDKVGDRITDFNEFISIIPKNEPRFIVYDVNCRTGDGRQFDKLLFAYWCPDTVQSAKVRFLYASAKKYIANFFKSTGSLEDSLDITLHDSDDLREENFIKAASRGAAP